MQDSYWSRFTENRMSRRRALAFTGGTALGAAFLAACGGSDSSGGGDSGASSGPKDSSGLLTQLKDESSSAKRGGTMVGVHPGVILSWDPFRTGINIRGARRGFSQLFRIQDGIAENTKGVIEGDLAESWELSPDKMTLTIKLDGGAGLPPIAPVNGRVIDSADILFTWERMKRQGTFRSELVNEINPGAPIASVTAPDARTVVVKMSEPNATIFSLLGTDSLGYLFIQPKESATWEPDKQAIGSGPFYVTDYSEVSYRWKRNPNFKRAKLKNGEPYLDEIFEPVIPEIAAAEAQLRSGAVYWYGVPADNIVTTKREVKDLLMYATSPNITGTERVYFGQNADSPFKDERVRIAFMKTMDRDAFVIAAHNTDRFAKEGLPVQEFWEAGLGAGTWTGWYLNPKDEKAFGPNAKNYKYDLAEAKKLIEAASSKTPLDVSMVYAAPSPTSFPASFYKRAEIFMGMVENSGVFKMKRDLITYQDWNTEKVRFSKGQFSGASWGPDTATGDPAANIFFLYNSKGGYFQGGDAKMDDLTAKARAEFDDKKRQELVHEAQRYNGEKFWNNKIGTAGGFALFWPILRNYGVFRGGTNWSDLRVYLDPTQPPKKS